MEPEMDLMQLSDSDLYEKLLLIADCFAQNPEALEWKPKHKPTESSFGVTVGDESVLKAQQKLHAMPVEKLCIEIIHLLDEYEVLLHSRRILRPRPRRRPAGPSANPNPNDEVTSDEKSIPNKKEYLTTQILALEPQIHAAVALERKQWQYPLLRGVHLKQVEPQLRRLKITQSLSNE